MVVYYLIDRFKSFLNICLIFISKNKPQHTYQNYSNKNEKNNLKLKYKPLKKYIYIKNSYSIDCACFCMQSNKKRLKKKNKKLLAKRV